MTSRRSFLHRATVGALGVAAARAADAADPAPAAPPASPPVLGVAAPEGPPVEPATFAEAEKLLRVTLTPAQREQAARAWPGAMAPLTARRTGPEAMALPDALAPATVWHPASVAPAAPARPARWSPSRPAAVPLPASEADIAHASVPQLSAWIAARAITSERLTHLYLDRIARLDGRLRSVITVSSDRALEEARRADAALAAGKRVGPLHGLPYGVKDLLDTAGVATTWGAEPLRGHVPARDAAVVARLRDAGAVLVAKLSLGALALNDVWFGGQTMNPWLPEVEGASGSSAGPGAATAAGLVAFSIGSETDGSIVSPSLRCGVTGLRPTFGRVPRTGAMTLCWSMDKLGPMTRRVEDAMWVLRAIEGPDGEDASCVKAPSPLSLDARAGVRGLRVGVFDAWMHEAPATDVDRAAVGLLRDAGASIVPLAWPKLPFQSLYNILFAESAASFEAWTADGRMDALRMQSDDAWPNTLRQARFLSAVELVQAERLRRVAAQAMAGFFEHADVLLVPGLREEMLTVSNCTGHPSLTVRTGTITVDEPRSDWAPDPAHPAPKLAAARTVPHGVTLVGRLFDEGTLAAAGLALERAAGVAASRPPGF